MDDDWSGSNDYWGSPQDTQQEPEQGSGDEPQAPQGIPGMTPMAPQQGIPGMQGQGGFPQGGQMGQGVPGQGAQGQVMQGQGMQGQGMQGAFPQNQPGAVPQGQQTQQEKPKSDNKSFVMILVILVVIAIVTVGVYFFQRGIKEKNSASITTSQQAQSNSNNGQSKSSGSQPSQGITGSPSERKSSPSKESPNTSWDSTNGDSGKTADVHGLSEVGSLPDVASRGTSGAIVASKHVYALDDGYVYSLELSLSTGQSNSVEFFVSKDNFDKINTGTIVSVEYVKYSDGRVGITSISSQGNSSEN